MTPLGRSVLGIALIAFGAVIVLLSILILKHSVDLHVVGGAALFVVPGLFLIDVTALPAIAGAVAKVTPWGKRDA